MKIDKVKIIFLAIFMLALAVRIAGLDRSFVLDEFRTIKFSSLSTGELLKALKVESYPPLTFLILSAWLKISHADIWIRLLFVIFGVLSVIVAYLIGRELLTPRYGLISMFFIAIMPMQVWVSQYARGIAPAIFFTLLGTFFFIRIFNEDAARPRASNTAGYIASSAMAIYSFYFSFFILLAQNAVYIYLNRGSLRKISRWFFLQGGIFLLFLPWTGYFLTQLRNADIVMNFSTVNNPGLKLFGLPIGLYLRSLAGLFGMDHAFLAGTAIAGRMSRPHIALMAAVITALLALSIYFSVRLYGKLPSARPAGRPFSPRQIFVIFYIFAFISLVITVFMNILFKSPIVSRYFAMSSAFIVFVYALTFGSFRNKKVFYAVMALCAALSAARLYSFTKADIDYKNPALFIRDRITAGDCLLFVEGDRAYEYYAGLPTNRIDSRQYIRAYVTGADNSPADIVDAAALKAQAWPFKSIWVYHSGETLSGTLDHVLRLLEGYGYRKAEERDFKRLDIYRYVKGA